MGINGLLDYMRKHGYQAVIFDDSKLKGKRIWIDASICMYTGGYGKSETNPDAMIRYIIPKIKEYLKKGALPIFVFDGIQSKMKIGTGEVRAKNKNSSLAKLKYEEDKLTELKKDPIKNLIPIIDMEKQIKQRKRNLNTAPTKTDVTKLKQFLELMMIPCVQMDYHDAENLCVASQKLGYCDYILTNDSDAIACGGDNILYYPRDKKNKKNNHILHIHSKSEVLKCLGLKNEKQLLNMCILLGTDFNKRKTGNGPVKVHGLIKNSSSDGCDEVKGCYPDNYQNIYKELEYDFSTKLPDDIKTLCEQSVEKVINIIISSIDIEKFSKITSDTKLLKMVYDIKHI